MKKTLQYLVIFYVFNTCSLFAQTLQTSPVNSSTIDSFKRGEKQVNKCTPWHHLKCIYITGGEVAEDGLKGKATRHWWRKSYIGRACTEQYGKTFGNIFEGFFAIPHYLSIGILNGATVVASIFKPSPEKVATRKLKREKRRAIRKERKRRRNIERLFN